MQQEFARVQYELLKKYMGNMIDGTILNFSYKTMRPTDASIQFKQLQVPIHMAFAITIIKSPEQIKIICGLDRENPCFSYVKLYFTCSILAT